MSNADLKAPARKKQVLHGELDASGVAGGYPDPKKPWQERFQRSGFLVGAVLFHLILFLMIATIVIWKVPGPRTDEVFQSVTQVKIPPPPPQPPSSGDAAQNPQMEPTPVAVPVVTPSSVIMSANSGFNLDAAKAINQAVNNVTMATAQGSGLTSGAGNTGPGNGSSFGAFIGGTNDFVGTVYDLKINPQHQPTGMNQFKYTRFLTDYVANGWRDADFAPYYEGPKKLFVPAIWIPPQDPWIARKVWGWTMN